MGYIAVLITISVIFSSGFLLPIAAYGQLRYLPHTRPEENGASNSAISNTTYSRQNTTTNKVVIINFDDDHQSDYTYAKPILDKYGFKATFFAVCRWIGAKDWQNIEALEKDGMDIQAHTMTHPNLNKLNEAQLSYEIGQSKQCLLNHGINSTIFAYPYGYGSNNATVVNIVSRYYDLARTNSYYGFTRTNTDDFPLAFLQCGANKSHLQPDCRSYSDDATLTFANRYSLNSWSHIHIEGNYSNSGQCTGVCHFYNNSKMLERFITAVNSQNTYNKDGIIRAIPIIVYHGLVTYPDVAYSKTPVETTVSLFDTEMRYLHDNGFKVLTLSELGYDENNNSLYIKK
jgi:peptidoglycan/xylan/chitin deacetylase (PgdA/CDA1 family)